MSEDLTEDQARARADTLTTDIDYAERAGLSNDSVDRLYRMYDRLDARATAAGFGPL